MENVTCNHHSSERETIGLPFPVLGTPCSCADTYAAIVAGEDIPGLRAFCALVRESARHPEKLTSFASDLITWDRAALTDHTGPFLWVLRESGTVLLLPTNHKSKGFSNRLTVRGILNAFGPGNAHLWFWWDGRFLRAVTPEQAETLVREVEFGE
jgi:hypothetical protein